MKRELQEQHLELKYQEEKCKINLWKILKTKQHYLQMMILT